MHHDRSIDHPCIFADHLPLFLNTLNSENMSWHHTRQCIESVAPRQFFFLHMSRTMCKMTNSTHHTTVRFFFSALPSIPHYIISFQPSESISIPKTLLGCIRVAPVIWQILLFSIVGLILRPGHVQNKFEPCVVVAHVLFVGDESRGDYFPVCLFSLPCH